MNHIKISSLHTLIHVSNQSQTRPKPVPNLPDQTRPKPVPSGYLQFYLIAKARDLTYRGNGFQPYGVLVNQF